MSDTQTQKAPLSALGAAFPQVQHLAAGFPGLLNKQWMDGGDGGAGDAIIPIGIFATLHAIRIAYEVRKGVQVSGRRPLMQELFTMLTFSFGGAILTALMLGRAQPWLENNTTVPVYAGAYILMACMPGDLLYKFLRQTAPVSDVFLASVDGLIRGYGVTAAGVDLVRNTMKGHAVADSLVAWVVVGTVLGSGGGIIDDFVQISAATWGLRVPTMLRQGLSMDVKLSFGATVGYILTTHAWSFAEHAPGFPLSSLLDSVLACVPRLSDQEAHLLSGLLCSTVLGTAAHVQARAFAATERRALEVARRKKYDEPSSDDNDDDDDDADVESDD
ncbi:hypothetical protein IW140_004446 [Coemansia sp. RSA 1813]|nr:hypothetical protein EV178_004531 [Coemansia sp. RSA 1646]KAJ1765493.1 hypothetical protein LPJ74_006327 [Coemansia sp. RSA 1843]KAJ2087843.1 hypothetical protein IW138_004640 [Coemansia sp. RSA 986]KAJ2212735.1 hypothetical protein EV179_004388 [Coemansia sp. RSA 487]KAJ2567474.1 hypothetical protein IW140_004446 [Coemansia sp. RSA 1813]